jgi:hypothetical protein
MIQDYSIDKRKNLIQNEIKEICQFYEFTDEEIQKAIDGFVIKINLNYQSFAVNIKPLNDFGALELVSLVGELKNQAMTAVELVEEQSQIELPTDTLLCINEGYLLIRTAAFMYQGSFRLLEKFNQIIHGTISQREALYFYNLESPESPELTDTEV